MFRPIANTRSNTGIPTGRLAVWWLLGSEIVIFGGVLVPYLFHRLGHGEDFALQAAHTNPWIGAFNTFVLLTSSLSAVMAHVSAENGDGKKAGKFLWLTVLGGAIFLMVKSYEWSVEIAGGFTITSHPFWGFYYTAAGIHASHVIVGMIIMAYVAFRAGQGKFLNRVELVAIYWHFVDLVWIFLFPLLYIAK
jgi:heme/copper-type cytochrome/quinol oxidase subunit 3